MSTRTPFNEYSTGRKTEVVAGLIIVIGSLMPWVTVGFVSAAGTQGDGVLTLIIGLLLGISALQIWTTRSRWIHGIFAILVVLITGAVFANLADVGLSSVGTGVYVTIIGGIAAAWGATTG